MSRQRQVLPGLFYHLPPRQEKQSPVDMEETMFRALMQEAGPEVQADKFLLDTFTALSPCGPESLPTGPRQHRLPPGPGTTPVGGVFRLAGPVRRENSAPLL